MATLRELLGSAYKEGMTFEEAEKIFVKITKKAKKLVLRA